ncbi:Fatty acid metabolism regulator protein [Nocardioides dokdonensis FR1436]|uniref:Fatty acid metabolism regulator protein n=1 Tax=Nocardioides dokdonensis FR1436 TaxID=1300347 RepID=A0A1A9GKN5_9ACTN|nr:TetR/AcrR family transcriptional regulator [Nocardioides dokdonensis]ANH38240.1 Fatty acid metabolism regulator protein [Nocardioides dokdonensis FR1436]
MSRVSESGRRDQILRATCEVIADQGFRSLRVSDVAKRIGTATGTVHYYFPTKRDLLHAAFEHNFSRSLERRRQIIDAEDDPLTRLRALVESYLPEGEETERAWRVWAELWIEALHEPELQVINDAVYGEWRAMMAGLIRECQEQGLVRQGDAVIHTNLLIGAVDGLAIQVILGSRSMTIDRMRQVCTTYLDSLVEDVHV